MPRRRGSKPAARSSPAAAGVARVVDALPVVGGHGGEALSLGRDVVSAFRRNRLGTHSTALAYRVLVSLVPLALLGIGLLGAFGLDSYWTNSVSPTLHRHLTEQVADAVDDTAYRIFAADSVGLLLFASALLVWNTLRGIRSIEHALDEIHEEERTRSPFGGFLVGLPLAVAVDISLLGAIFVVVAAPRLVSSGFGHDLLVGLRWVGAVALLWVTVTLLIRYAPAEKPEVRWASGGSALVVGGWLAASAAFGFWSASVANYKSATGTLTAFLVLTAYTLAVAYVFVLGVQLDETLRRRQHGTS
jgi:membrane protein